MFLFFNGLVGSVIKEYKLQLVAIFLLLQGKNDLSRIIKLLKDNISLILKRNGGEEMDNLINYSENIFESIKHIDENGNEYWSARELQKVLEYK